MKILNHTKLLLASSLLALTLGSQACPDDQQVSQASFRALKVTLSANGESVDDLLMASMATGGSAGVASTAFERLRAILSFSAGNTTQPAAPAANAAGIYLPAAPATPGTTTSVLAARVPAIAGARNVIELTAALNVHATGA